MEVVRATKNKKTFIKEHILFRKNTITVFKVGDDYHITVKNYNLYTKDLSDFIVSPEYGFILMQIKRVYPNVFGMDTNDIRARFVKALNDAFTYHLVIIVKHYKPY